MPDRAINIVCRAERSQHQNRAMALKVLKAKLYEKELQKREAQNAAYNAGKSAINFGSQMRNYVLAPYRLVKDVRTSTETGNVDAVLDGDLDAFIEAYLLARRRRLAQKRWPARGRSVMAEPSRRSPDMHPAPREA
jgi:peptide chain release factor 2